MQELTELAKKLLTDGTVNVVIGYEEGPSGVRMAAITNPNDAGKLVFDQRCIQSLPVYLSARRNDIKSLGKPAIVVKGCDAAALAQMIKESQLKREEVVIIGVRCGGVVLDPNSQDSLSVDNVSERCGGCTLREPSLCDHLVGPLPPEPPTSTRREETMAKLAAMSHQERLAFWTKEFAKCVRCHACREVCPMCYCKQCITDKSIPQWIDSSPHTRGNFSWHIQRALHHAGRCIDCGECERACPVDIPLSLLNRQTAKTVETRYHYKLTDDPEVKSPIGTFSTEDEEEFIL